MNENSGFTDITPSESGSIETVRQLIEPALAVFLPSTTVEAAIDSLRDMVKQTVVTYGFLADDQGILLGVFAFRELLFADKTQTLADISILNPFSLGEYMTLQEAMQETVSRHFPVYPVCDATGRLLGIVRGYRLFEAQAFEISAQAGGASSSTARPNKNEAAFVTVAYPPCASFPTTALLPTMPVLILLPPSCVKGDSPTGPSIEQSMVSKYEHLVCANTNVLRVH